MSQDFPTMRVALAQSSGSWLQREAGLATVVAAIDRAADQGCQLVAFGEGLVPGYPFWIEHTDGARFDSELQKALYAHYASQAVQIEAGHLSAICASARDHRIAVYLGIIERPPDRGGHSLYASLVYIDQDGLVGSVHRKLMPTYEERLVWAQGDGHGLQVHPLHGFHIGGLNCWENWMPLARSALYAQGENVHVAVWPGNERNTRDITRFIARESRSYVVSVSGLLSREDVADSVPHADLLRQALPVTVANGGSCVAGPDGEWVLPPQSGEGVFAVELALKTVYQERQNFDPSGHYSRPDVTQLHIDRSRRTLLQRG